MPSCTLLGDLQGTVQTGRRHQKDTWVLKRVSRSIFLLHHAPARFSPSELRGIKMLLGNPQRYHFHHQPRTLPDPTGHSVGLQRHLRCPNWASWHLTTADIEVERVAPVSADTSLPPGFYCADHGLQRLKRSRVHVSVVGDRGDGHVATQRGNLPDVQYDSVSPDNKSKVCGRIWKIIAARSLRGK